jgi:hypothetical protein
MFDGETATVNAWLITTCAVAIFVGSACKTAAMVTADGEGMSRGAVYRPVASIVPCVDSPPVVPFTCHVTAGLEVLATAAVNFFVPKTGTEVLVGVTDIWAPWAVWLAANGEPELAHPQDMKPIPKNTATNKRFRRRTKLRNVMNCIPRQKRVVSSSCEDARD